MDDNVILEWLAMRDERALAEVSRKYGRMCRRVAQNILNCEQDAEECVNDTFAALWNSIPPARPKSLTAFICGITRNLAYKKLEYNNAARRRTRADVSLDELAGCLPYSGGESSTPGYTCDAAQLSELLNSFLATLEPLQRRAFVRRYWLSDSIYDVAAACGMSQAATKSMLHRIRGRLKKYLEKEGITV